MTVAAASVNGAATQTHARRPRRAYRAWLPVLLVLGILVTTAITYAVEQPDPGDPRFLSPTSRTNIGASRLSRQLEAAGVPVRRMTRTPDALVAAGVGDATLFVPAPAAIHPAYLRMFEELPASTRIVLVAPSNTTLSAGNLPLVATDRRWATGAVPPERVGGSPCELAEARRAGTAAALRQRYATTDGPGGCYDGGLVRVPGLLAELVVTGASDPFRNDRIGENGNAALAIGLLSTRSRVLWLDRHELEPPPAVPDPPSDGPSEPSSLHPRPGTGDDEQGEGPGGGQDSGDGDGDSTDQAEERSQRNPLWDAFPSWFWVLLTLLAIAALITVLARARRLGPPVAEPLPVGVRAHETVLGRGRLYQRAHASQRASEVLREAARNRMGQLLNRPAENSPDALVDAVANHAGLDRDTIQRLLYGPPAQRDTELVQLARDLHSLPGFHEGDSR